MSDTTPSYLELSSQTYGTLVDAFASANQRTLEYAKSFWEIASRPYASLSPENVVRDNFERSNHLVALTVEELQSRGRASADLATKMGAHYAKLQDSYVASLRGLMNTGISNANFVKETATQQFDEMGKRLEELQQRAAAQVSQN